MKYVEFIKDKFKGQPVHVVASGPSLFGFDYSKLDNCNVIAVNHAFKFVKHDFTVSVDNLVKREEDTVVDPLKTPYWLTRLIRDFRHLPNVITLKFFDTDFSFDPEQGVYHSRLAGCAALCVALQSGASHVYLWGFDCRFFTFSELVESTVMHGHTTADAREMILETIGDLPKYAHGTSGRANHSREKLSDEGVFVDTIKHFQKFPRDVVTNMSMLSAIPYFDRMDPRRLML